MGFDEGRLSGFLREAADEVAVTSTDRSRLVTRTRRYQLVLGVSTAVLTMVVLGSAAFLGTSIVGEDNSGGVTSPAQASLSPSNSPTSPEASPTERGSEEGPSNANDTALETGNGRIPLGDVSLCPSGDLGEGKSVRKDDVIAATPRSS